VILAQIIYTFRNAEIFTQKEILSKEKKKKKKNIVKGIEEYF
jgi:hypothetical protein